MDNHNPQPVQVLCALLVCVAFSWLQYFAVQQACVHSVEELRQMQVRHRAEARGRRQMRRKIIRAACVLLKKVETLP